MSCITHFPPMKAGDTYQAIDLKFTDTDTGDPLAFPINSVGRAQIREIRTKALLMEWVVTVAGDTVTLEEVTKEATALVKAGTHSAELDITTPDGRRTTWIDHGRIPVTADYAYV